MKSIDNIIMVILLLVALLLLPSLIRYRVAASAASSSAKSAVQDLLRSVETNGQLSMEDFEYCVDALGKCGYFGELRVTATIYELGAEGSYVFDIVWDEIADSLLECGTYTFPESCYIKAVAFADSKNTSSLLSAFGGRQTIQGFAYIGGSGL